MTAFNWRGPQRGTGFAGESRVHGAASGGLGGVEGERVRRRGGSKAKDWTRGMKESR